MGLFSSLFGSPTQQRPSCAIRLATECFTQRRDGTFLDYYTSRRPESPATLMRFRFSQDVLMVLMATLVSMNRFRNDQRRMQFNEEVRTRYLSMIPVAPTSLVGDCFVCDDELEAIGAFIAPGATLPQLRTTIASTTGLMSLAIDYRAQEFRDDIWAGVREVQMGAYMMWDPVAKSFLSRVRGVARDSISSDDVNYFAAALDLPATLVMSVDIESE